jgi:hypothetical protein
MVDDKLLDYVSFCLYISYSCVRLIFATEGVFTLNWLRPIFDFFLSTRKECYFDENLISLKLRWHFVRRILKNPRRKSGVSSEEISKSSEENSDFFRGNW